METSCCHLSLSKGEGRVRVFAFGRIQDPSPQSSPRKRGEAEKAHASNHKKLCSRELFQKPQVILREEPDIRNFE